MAPKRKQTTKRTLIEVTGDITGIKVLKSKVAKTTPKKSRFSSSDSSSTCSTSSAAVSPTPAPLPEMTPVLLRDRLGPGGDLAGLAHPSKIGMSLNKSYLQYITYIMGRHDTLAWTDACEQDMRKWAATPLKGAGSLMYRHFPVTTCVGRGPKRQGAPLEFEFHYKIGQDVPGLVSVINSRFDLQPHQYQFRITKKEFDPKGRIDEIGMVTAISLVPHAKEEAPP